MNSDIITVPAEDRILVIADEDREVDVPGEVRLIEIEADDDSIGQ